MTASGQVEAAATPLPGAQINSMIFSLIPNDIKQQLPNQPEVAFVHPHALGNFNFCVRKSPSGFNVTIMPGAATDALPEEALNDQQAEQPNDVEMDATAGSTQAEPPQNEAVETPSDESSEPDQSGQESTPEIVETSGPMEMAPEYTLENDAEPTVLQSEEFSPEGGSDEFASTGNQSGDESGAVEIEVEAGDSSVYEGYTDAQGEYQSEAETVGAPAVQYDTETNATNFAPTRPAETSAIPAAIEQTIFTPADQEDRTEMDALFVKMAEAGASDLHLSVSMPPLVRKDGKMMELAPGFAKLTNGVIEDLLKSIMPDKNKEEFAERNDTDFAYEIDGLARFRANVFRDRKGMGGVFRIIPSEIMTADDLGLSKAIMNLTELSKGLVVVTGPTGSGKSTTLCAMVDSINKNREDHIITIEDPIEFTHENIKCLVNQREVHNHTRSFKNALRAALREDPDILLVGEMRDLETISIAIETAETGHLVFGTLHTTTAASTVDRIIDQFPADRQQQIRVMLSESLKGVIAQTLLPKVGGGRIAALEVLIVTPAIANLIREGKTFQIASQMQTGKNLGMQMLNDSLMDLVEKGLVEPKDAYIKAIDKDHFETLLQRAGKKI